MDLLKRIAETKSFMIIKVEFQGSYFLRNIALENKFRAKEYTLLQLEVLHLVMWNLPEE